MSYTRLRFKVLNYISTTILPPTITASHHHRQLTSSIIPHLKKPPLFPPYTTSILSPPLTVAATAKPFPVACFHATAIRYGRKSLSGGKSTRDPWRLTNPTCSEDGVKFCFPAQLREYWDKKSPEIKSQYPIECKLCRDRFKTEEDKIKKHRRYCPYQLGDKEKREKKMLEVTLGEEYLKVAETKGWNKKGSIQNELKQFKYWLKTRDKNVKAAEAEAGTEEIKAQEAEAGTEEIKAGVHDEAGKEGNGAEEAGKEGNEAGEAGDDEEGRN